MSVASILYVVRFHLKGQLWDPCIVVKVVLAGSNQSSKPSPCFLQADVALFMLNVKYHLGL